MTQPIKILIAEDNDSDAELLLRALRRAGYEPEWQRVEAEAPFIAALSPALDLVLSDYSMPQFNGLRALELAKASHPDIPFIIVSGTIGEETAVEAMRLGATDYLLKDRLGRLGPSISRALELGRLRLEQRKGEEALRDSEARYRALFDYAPDGMLIASMGGVYRDANASACRMFGYARAEFIGLEATDIVVTEETQHIAPALEQIKAGTDYHREWRFRRKDGTTFPADVSATAMPDGNLLAVIRDSTQRRETEQRVRDQLAELLRWQEAMLGREDRVQALKAEVNALLAERNLPLRYGQTPPTPMKAPIPGNESERLETLRSYGILDTPGEQAFDDLTLLAAHICGVPTAMVSLVDENRQWFKSRLGLSASETSRDIAFCAHTILCPDEVLEVHDAEADPRFASSPLVTADPHIRFYAGAPLVSPSGHALGALCVMDNTPRRLSEAQREALRALSRRVVAQLELRRHARDLTARELESGRLLDLAEKSRRALLSVLEDEKLAARALRESEERFRRLIENASDMIAVIDEGGVIRFQSPSTPRLLGYAVTDMQGRRAIEFIHPEDCDKVADSIGRALEAEDTPVKVEFRIRHRDGSWRILQSIGKRMTGDAGRPQIVVNSRDITESRALEQQFLHAQRMEAIGTLASGVAHDLNNILAPIMMVAGLLKMEDKLSPKDEEMLSMIERSGQRGADIIRQLLTFSRSIPGERGLVQPKHLIHEMVGIMRETFPRNIAIVETVPANLWTIEADPTQLHQVLMNLCVNARDAMAGGGTLTVMAENLVGGPSTVKQGDPARLAGPCVLIKVRDTGSGIPPEIIGRIFEPFFTTKGVGKGTGLGLSTVVGIVRGHGGVVTVESEPGKGTSFLIHLPAVKGQGLVEGGSAEFPLAAGRGELILVVDDEELIRETTGSLLELQGYRVLLAGSGEEGVRLFTAHQDEVQLILTDVMMPGMDGLTMIRKARAMRPAIRAIAASGLGQSLDRAEYATAGAGEILAKPFTPRQLLEVIARSFA